LRLPGRLQEFDISRFEAPLHVLWLVRRLIRRDEAFFIGLACAVGGIAGLCVSVLYNSANLLHYWLFGHRQLSNLVSLDSPIQAAVPLAGGLILGILGIYVRKRVVRRPVDPIEANALQGGRMSLKDSMFIAVQTVISNGFGASVGMEAAYTQMGSGFASFLGTLLRLRRGDMRTLVACGSAGAIGAAFGAPLTGAFYGFELILGSYTPFTLAPVGAAAVCGVLVSRALGSSGEFVSPVVLDPELSIAGTAILLLLGIICALFGIAMMRAATFVEGVCVRCKLAKAVQPAAGGLIVGLLALVTPQVLGSGHGALARLLETGPSRAPEIATVLLLKAFGSAVSIGSGFRGGLFFASLFLGGLLGQLYFLAAGSIDPMLTPGASVCTLVGMTALAVAIIGAPLTMGFLALEATGNFPLSLVMLAVASIVSIIVRRAFGYSFATWRLHLRGESIRSARDVGWMRELTAGRLMRTDVPKVPLDMTIAGFMKEFPARSTSQWAVLTGPSGDYKGMVFVPDAHLAGLQAEADFVRQLARATGTFLLPEMNIKLAAQIFEQTETDALAVVNNERERHVIGLLTEAHVLRRYSDELNKAHHDLSGESWLGGRAQ
jgi:CIC family chloride channel protein